MMTRPGSVTSAADATAWHAAPRKLGDDLLIVYDGPRSIQPARQLRLAHGHFHRTAHAVTIARFFSDHNLHHAVSSLCPAFWMAAMISSVTRW